MKPIKFFIAFTLYFNCFGQIDSNFEENSYPEQMVEFQNELNKIIQGKPKILVPFQKDEKWGYMDYETKEILVHPKASWLNIIQSNVENGEIGMIRMNEESYTIIIRDSEVTTLKIGPPIYSEMEPERDWMRPASFNVKIIEDEKFKGFTYEVNEEGYLFINCYSKLYQTANNSFPLLTPVYLEKDVVAIAIQNDENTNLKKVGLIYPDGRSVNGFEFNFSDIKPLRLTNKNLGTHFLVQKLNSNDLNYHIANSKGEIISESILPNLDYLQNFRLEQKYTPYYLSFSTLEFELNSGKLIDLYNLKEVKISDENLYFSNLIYLITKEITTEDVEELRKNAIIFVNVREENGFEYYMDLSGKKFKVPQ